MGSEPGILRSASQTSFQLLEAGCFLVAPSLAVLLGLPPMGNTLPSQVKSYCEILIVDQYPRPRDVWQIRHRPDEYGWTLGRLPRPQ